jgi:hypothetical protein
MCVHCETYDYSRSCGSACSDHEYRFDETLSDEEGSFERCGKCGSVRYDD